MSIFHCTAHMHLPNPPADCMACRASLDFTTNANKRANELQAALTAAAEREAALREENARLKGENAVLVKAIEFDYEPDLPEDECTTASMLYKIALQWDTLREIATANPDSPNHVYARLHELVTEHSWPHALRRRADFIEKRARKEYRAEAALTEAQRERDSAEASTRQMQDRLQRAVDGATAERQKVTALREWHVAGNKRSRHEGSIVHLDALDKMDALGLTAAESTQEQP